MSLFQAIIGSAVGPSGPAWQYPPPGNGYPVAGTTQTGPAGTVSGYYEAGSLVGPNLGMIRRTYMGTAFSGNYIMDSNFPQNYGLMQMLEDQYIGFSIDDDVATNFTMEWIGYYKPAQSGEHLFVIQADDYAQMWIGETAVSGFSHTNAIIQANNDIVGSAAFPMVANRYYPVRIRFVEVSGAHRCTIWSGLKDTVIANNMSNPSVGQFQYDTNSVNGGFPSTGLIT